MAETDSGHGSLAREVYALRQDLSREVGLIRVDMVRQSDSIQNELHRHQDDDREDFKAVRSDIRTVGQTMDEWRGGVNLLKLITIPCSVIAAVGVIINMFLRH